MIPLEYITDSIKGTERKENKDRTLVIPSENYLLAILFDGISSAPDANKGIDIAVNFIKENYTHFASNEKYDLANLMHKTHLAIIQSKFESPYSTFSAICIAQNRNWAIFSNLGDSRIYEITPQYIKQLSKDDNLVHRKNIVTKYLGMLELEANDFLPTDFDFINKRILLCSDGFYSFLEQDIKKFHTVLNFDRAGNIKNNLLNEISEKNIDDSSYILIF